MAEVGSLGKGRGQWAVLAALMVALALLARGPAAAQSVPCYERPTYRDNPWTLVEWCLEQVIDDPAAGRMGYVALATGDDGTLYATRPLAGQVMALTKPAPDALPANPRVVADGLTLPNGLAFHDGTLYISGGPFVHRLRDGRLETLADDLPAGGGFWTGGLAIGPDERLYVGIGAPCDLCAPDVPERGAILSMALDGSDRRVVATGLRHPAGLAFLDGALWVGDTAPDATDTPDADELNRVTPGAHFGWPYCAGFENAPALPGDFDCGRAVAPELAFPTHSAPVALAAYTANALPGLRDSLLVVLGGSTNEVEMEGFALVSVPVDDGAPDGYSLTIPAQSASDPAQFTLRQYNYRGSGIWPRRPLGVAVGPEGWVYLSLSEGQILALRPKE